MTDYPTPPAAPEPLRGYEAMICLTGGIAAYKVAAVVSQLIQEGCGVTAALSRGARRFIGPTTFQALTGRPVLSSQWHTADPGAMDHLHPSETADVIVVAPATANILGKLANGIADDLVSTLLLGGDCPVLLAPAMNTRMWQHPAVQRNVAFLRQAGFGFVGPDGGRLACGTVGPGRMSEPDAILTAIRAQLLRQPPKSA